jgi:hypothetical protein
MCIGFARPTANDSNNLIHPVLRRRELSFDEEVVMIDGNLKVNPFRCEKISVPFDRSSILRVDLLSFLRRLNRRKLLVKQQIINNL